MHARKRKEYKNLEEIVLDKTGYLDIDDFLNTKKEYNIKFLDEAAKLIKEKIANNEKITIVGDYDVDGITATSIMYMTLKELNADINVRFPKRISEGYGLSTKIIDEIDSGLVLTVDNGIVAFDAIDKAKEKGLSVIVTDHHLMAEDGALPNADIVIDPHIEGTADFADYCGAGIAYKLTEKLISNDTLIKKLSCFAALGTICDVMPLVEDNRNIVKNGLDNMLIPQYQTSGLKALMNKLWLSNYVSVSDIGFKIGPVLNASGRLFDDGAKLPFEILTYDDRYDWDKANALVFRNEQRKQIVDESLPKFEAQIMENKMQNDFPIVIYEPGIPEGIIGIIAGKLAEKYDTPVFAFSDCEIDGIIKGSARTARDVNIKQLLDKCKEHLYKYGGHEAAAGLSIEKSKIDLIRKTFKENCFQPLDYYKDDTVYYDCEIDFKDLPKIHDELKKYEPFGEGNPNIVFKVKNFKLTPNERSQNGVSFMGKDNAYVKMTSGNVSAFGPSKKYLETLNDQLLYEISTFSNNNEFTNKEKNLIRYAISYATGFRKHDKLNELFNKFSYSNAFKDFVELQYKVISENKMFKQQYSFSHILHDLNAAKNMDVYATLSTNCFKGNYSIQLDTLGLQDPNRILDIDKENIINDEKINDKSDDEIR